MFLSYPWANIPKIRWFWSSIACKISNSSNCIEPQPQNIKWVLSIQGSVLSFLVIQNCLVCGLAFGMTQDKHGQTPIVPWYDPVNVMRYMWMDLPNHNHSLQKTIWQSNNGKPPTHTWFSVLHTSMYRGFSIAGSTGVPANRSNSSISLGRPGTPVASSRSSATSVIYVYQRSGLLSTLSCVFDDFWWILMMSSFFSYVLIYDHCDDLWSDPTVHI